MLPGGGWFPTIGTFARSQAGVRRLAWRARVASQVVAYQLCHANLHAWLRDGVSPSATSACLATRCESRWVSTPNQALSHATSPPVGSPGCRPSRTLSAVVATLRAMLGVRGGANGTRGALSVCPVEACDVVLQLRKHGGPFGVRQEGGGEAVAHQRDDVVDAEVQLALTGKQVLTGIAAEIRRVVRIDGHVQAVCEHGFERMRGDGGDHFQAEIRDRAHGQGNLAARQFRHKLRILEARDAVVDAVDVE